MLLEKARPIDGLLQEASRYFFFTGKGGVGKTSLASATALALAESGKKTLLVSTDPASNLDEVLGLELGREPRAVPGGTNFFALNINPEAAAGAYREKIVGPMRGLLPEAALREMEEQLSGACTMEIAAFDEFTSFLSGDGASDFDHIVFDTAPTGHTLRLMALSQAWTSFFNENSSGNSCLGPLAGLEKQRELYAHAVEVLKDPVQTRVVLVSRAQKAALKEARRSWRELGALGITNQSLALNGWFEPRVEEDHVAQRWQERQEEALCGESEMLETLPLYQAPLLPENLIGLEVLRAFFGENGKSLSMGMEENSSVEEGPNLPGLPALAEQLVGQKRGVILTMGKGGVGKTTLAAALGLALAEKGVKVRLSTTDPAAHLEEAFDGHKGDLVIDRIDPKAETEAYVEEVLAQQPKDLDAESRALLEEDLRSPCTEEIAVFRAFARTVAQGEDGFVVLDTAPTGHTLLLLDATQSYHRELGRQSRTTRPSEAIEKLLPRLRDPDFTKVVLVTLPEATPVHEAAALQSDLRRAGIEPQGWVINQSLAGVKTAEPLLQARGREEVRYLREVVETHAKSPVYRIPWCPVDPSGEGLKHLFSQT
ncbi:MAG: arsenical pump-driving ATPase [Opitutales bacterium]|nr:arsenical pump-driving ATPase [Opitutales bacterium]